MHTDSTDSTDSTDDTTAERFEQSREHLRAVAYRMLGSHSEAEDAVQESWLRLGRADIGSIENLPGWLTTVIGRICLDMLRARKARREESLTVAETVPHPDDDGSPEHEVLRAESVGRALLVVLETLSPAERVAFVLHDLFDVSFEEIAPIVGRSTAAARQLASRGRRRVREGETHQKTDLTRQRDAVEAFRAAARDGNFEALLAVLDPNIVLTADSATVRFGAAPELIGATAIARTFSGRAAAARSVTVDGLPGLAWIVRDQVRVVFRFTVTGDTITRIDLVGDPATLAAIDVVPAES